MRTWKNLIGKSGMHCGRSTFFQPLLKHDGLLLWIANTCDGTEGGFLNAESAARRQARNSLDACKVLSAHLVARTESAASIENGSSRQTLDISNALVETHITLRTGLRPFRSRSSCSIQRSANPDDLLIIISTPKQHIAMRHRSQIFK